MKKAQAWLTAMLDYEFDDASLFELALSHRSASGASNERLEFLGDAVLDTVVSEVLYKAHPDAPEGDLSRLRASLVRDSSLAELAVQLGLGEQLKLGGGERKSGGHRRESILADALEALFGAVYLDGGFAAADQVIRKALGNRLQVTSLATDLRDPKTQLQEWLQSRQLALPVYELSGVSGQAHRQLFEASCAVADLQKQTWGQGSTRRHAEQQAAELMLETLAIDTSG